MENKKNIYPFTRGELHYKDRIFKFIQPTDNKNNGQPFLAEVGGKKDKINLFPVGPRDFDFFKKGCRWRLHIFIGDTCKINKIK